MIALGAYVFATKYTDGDPGDPWGVGFYAGMAYEQYHRIVDNQGKTIYAPKFRRVEEITPEIGNWLLENGPKLIHNPDTNLWDHVDRLRGGV